MLEFLIPIKPLVQLAKPTGVSFTPLTSSTLRLDWTNGNADAVIQVYRNGALLVTKAKGTITHTDTGLSAGTTYTYTLRHYLAAAGGVEDRWSVFTAPVYGYTVPATPTGFSAVANGTAADLAWTNPNPALSTEVWRADGGGASSLLVTKDPGDASHSDSGLSDNTYHYKLRATDGSTPSDYTSVQDVTIDTTVDPPTSLSVTMTEKDAAVGWTNYNGTYQIRVYRDGVNVSGNLAATTTTYADNAVSGGSHTWAVRHWDGANESVNSNTDTKTVPYFTKPSGLTLDNTVYSDRVTASWTNGDASQPTEIWRATEGGSMSLLATAAAGATSYNDDTVAYGGTTYHYKLRHYNAGQDSNYTAIVDKTTTTPSLTLDSLDFGWNTDLITVAFTVQYAPQGAVVNAITLTDDTASGSSPFDDANTLSSPADIANSWPYYHMCKLATAYPLATFTLGSLELKLGSTVVDHVDNTTVDYRFDVGEP